MGQYPDVPAGGGNQVHDAGFYITFDGRPLDEYEDEPSRASVEGPWYEHARIAHEYGIGREQFYELSMDDQVDRIAFVRARNKLESLSWESRTKELKVKDDESPEEKNRRALEEHTEKMRQRRDGN